MIGLIKTDKTIFYVYNYSMYKQIVINLTTLFFGMILVLPSASAAGPKAKAPDPSRLQKEELLCRQIQDKIKNKQEIRKVVKTSIQMGYDACGAIKCAIKGNGDSKQIIEGAVEAGTTKDVVSRCSLDACTEVKDIAAISGVYFAKALDSIQSQKEGPICGQIQDKIKNKQETREIVKTSIQRGYDACGVIRCAVKSGGEVSQAIAGAIDAGSTKDIASRCILEACAKDVAVILSNMAEPGLGYSLPEEPEVIISPLTDAARGGAFISPSGF
jgi:hypothetical protein